MRRAALALATACLTALAVVPAKAEALIAAARPALALYGPVKLAPTRARLAERLAA